MRLPDRITEPLFDRQADRKMVERLTHPADLHEAHSEVVPDVREHLQIFVLFEERTRAY